MDEKKIELGELEPLFREFLEVIENTADELIEIPYDSMQVADNINKINVVRIMADLTLDNLNELSKRFEKAKYKTISAREHALTGKGFAGAILQLFVKINEINDETDSRKVDELQEQIILLSAIRPEHRKGALFLGEMKKDYYWGGSIISI